MQLMEIDRRSLLVGAGAVLLGRRRAWGRRDGEQEFYAAARKRFDGGDEAAIFNLAHGDVAVVDLPARGHAVATRPGTRECVVFARRPGNFAVAFSADGKRPRQTITTRNDRHFYGHGVFSSDGRLLYSSENDFEAGTGVIGVRDATAGYRQIGELSSAGVGPHELALLSDGRTLVIANGGIRTHPSYARQALNLSEMAPTLAYVDIVNGDILEVHSLAPALKQLSIRHLAVAANDVVVFGCQHKGRKVEQPPLLGLHRRGGGIELMEEPVAVYRDLRNYVASVTVDRAGEIVAATSSRGSTCVFVDVATKRIIGRRKMADVSGLAARPRGRGFLLTNGNGQLLLAEPGVETEPKDLEGYLSRVAWENHASSL